MKLKIFITTDEDVVLLDKEVTLDKRYTKNVFKGYELPDKFSFNEQIDIAYDVLRDRKLDSREP